MSVASSSSHLNYYLDSDKCDEILLSSLKKYFGYNEFRPNQLEICRCILQRKDVFVVMATGAGKMENHSSNLFKSGSLIHLLTYSLTHLFTYSLIHLLTYKLIHQLVRSLTHSLTHSLTREEFNLPTACNSIERIEF